MILYHGSFVVVAQPDLLHSRPNVDFGKAFMSHPFMSRLRNGATDLSVVVRMVLYHGMCLTKVCIEI